MYLALDLGTKRTGVAVSAGDIAREYTTLQTTDSLAEQLAEICQAEGVERIIVGLPYSEDGTPTQQGSWVEMISEDLKGIIGLPITFEDEVLTTVEARRILAEMGLNPAEIDQRVDQYAAQIILQQYLDRGEDKE